MMTRDRLDRLLLAIRRKITRKKRLTEDALRAEIVAADTIQDIFIRSKKFQEKKKQRLALIRQGVDCFDDEDDEGGQ